MKHFATLLFISLLCVVSNAQAQTFTDRLKQKKDGQGSVTVIQSKEIENLVNGKNITKTQAGNEEATTSKSAEEKLTEGKKNQQPNTTANERKENETEASHREENTHAEASRRTEEKNYDNDGMEIPSVDLRKKVMRKSYKVTGYRVQAFAGGNTRADRKKAENIRTAIKMKFPNQPVYVHFYSPRWICRVGNYRTYEEAHWMLNEIRKMGYKSAIIVKGKITVQY